MTTITISNKKLIEEIDRLYLTVFTSKDNRQMASVKSHVLRQAFSVKNGEIDSKKTKDYERKMTMSIDSIVKWFNEYINCYEYQKEIGGNRVRESKNSIHYFIDGIEFIDKKLALQFKTALQQKI